MDDLIYPPISTYFIAWEGNSVSYGLNEPNQCTASGLANFEAYTDYSIYKARLLNFNIDLDAISAAEAAVDQGDIPQ